MSVPYKVSPMHAWHRRNRGQMAEVDGWKRVLSYGDPASEWKACQGSVGVCDVTPITKIDLLGRDAENVFRTLANVPTPAVGHCASVIQRDGTSAQAARLRADRILLLGADEDRLRLLQWAANASEQNCAHATDLTSAYAAIRLVGPRTPALLKKLTSAPIDALPDRGCLQAGVARVPAILIRSDSGGQYVSLLLVSRDYGAYVWECVLTAGHEFGVQPFGMIVERRIAGREVSDVAVV